mmetsp:Transcript_135297/g.337567  ORF Transcript_135297/g.337567 Transcript_135297/m.337567 type:complete len:234 (-) Transcript_135297:36-737(-)
MLLHALQLVQSPMRQEDGDGNRYDEGSACKPELHPYIDLQLEQPQYFVRTIRGDVEDHAIRACQKHIREGVLAEGLEDLQSQLCSIHGYAPRIEHGHHDRSCQKLHIGPQATEKDNNAEADPSVRLEQSLCSADQVVFGDYMSRQQPKWGLARYFRYGSRRKVRHREQREVPRDEQRQPDTEPIRKPQRRCHLVARGLRSPQLRLAVGGGGGASRLHMPMEGRGLPVSYGKRN